MPGKGIGIWIRKQKRNPYAGRLVVFVLCGNAFLHALTHAHVYVHKLLTKMNAKNVQKA